MSQQKSPFCTGDAQTCEVSTFHRHPPTSNQFLSRNVASVVPETPKNPDGSPQEGFWIREGRRKKVFTWIPWTLQADANNDKKEDSEHHHKEEERHDAELESDERR